MPQPFPYQKRKVLGKGVGLVAATLLIEGTLLLAEEPLFTIRGRKAMGPEAQEDINEVILAECSNLGEEQLGSFMQLCDLNPPSKSLPRATAIFLNNYVPLGARQSGIFLDYSRINHSCRPNANVSWNPSKMQLEVRAIKDIVSGEEITISYYGREHENSGYFRRRRHLDTRYGFFCNCVICKADPETKRIDDANRAMMLQMLTRVRSLEAVNPAWALELCRELVILCFKFEKYLELPDVYYWASRICIKHGDVARAAVFLRLYIRQTEINGGPEAISSKLRSTAEDPTKCETYRQRRSEKWHSQLKDIREEGTAGYDLWLWSTAER